MRNLSILFTALELIEERLREPMNVADLAKLCFSSYSGLQKLFNYAFHCSVNEYITKRRITCAAQELKTSNKSVTMIALDYQYGSPEAFSRAFKRCWGISPNNFRQTRRFTELLPKLILEINNGGIVMQNRRPLDISELYDELKKLRGTYVFSIDIISFSQVNKSFGIAAGDIVIAETFARLERNLSEDMLLFRIGGDEFAVVTGYSSLSDAEVLARRITAFNGETVKANTKDIPLSLRIGISLLADEPLNYRKALDIMYGVLDKAREENNHIAIYTE